MKIPANFSLVEQPANSRVCGAACCAMALGKTLECVMLEVDWRSLTYPGGIGAYLGAHGVTMGLWFPDCEDFPIAHSFSLDPSRRPALLAVTSRFKDLDHWVFWDGNQILDPSPMKQDKYRVLEAWYLAYHETPEWVYQIPHDAWNTLDTTPETPNE